MEELLKQRTAKNRLKVEHRIIGGVQECLERLLERNEKIRSVIPGVIRKVRDAKGPVRIRVTVPTTNGWKAIALAAGQRQELFISTSSDKEELESAIVATLLELS